MAPSVGLPRVQDFEVYYEARLGVRREPAEDGDDGPQPRGSDHLAGSPSMPRANGGADLAVFEQFDADHSGAVDRAEFRDEMRRIMLAVAEGLGSQPLQVAVDDEGGSFLLEAAEHEAAAIAAKLDAERKAEAAAAAADAAE